MSEYTQFIGSAARGGIRISSASLRWWVLAVISLAQLMLILDTTIVSIALPSLQRTLDMSDANRQWVITAYTLAFGGLLLLGGRVASYVGRRNALITGLIGFAAASAIGGLAANQEMLITSRALQGLFGAIIAPTALAALTTTFTDPGERAKAFGIFGALSAGGAAFGLLMGGILTDYLDWRWTFFVNIPLALIAVVGAVGTMSGNEERAQTARLDIRGAALGTTGLVALVFGFNRAKVNGWGTASTIGWLVASVVVLSLFIMTQRTVAHPMLPLRLLTDRNRTGSYAASIAVPFALFGMFFFLTYFFQVVRDYSPVRTGLAFLPLSAAIIVGSQIAARMMTRVSPRVPVGIGFAIIAAGLLLLTRLELNSSYLTFILPVLIITGLGAPLVFVTVLNTGMIGATGEDAGVSGAVLNTSQQIGASVGTSLLSTLAASATSAYVNSHAGDANVSAIGMVHGFGSATAWSAAIVFAFWTIVFAALNAGKPTPMAEGEAPVLVHAS